MTVTLSWEALAALAAWAMVMVALVGGLMKKFAALDAKFAVHLKQNFDDATAARAQIADIALTTSENYMRRREVEVLTRDLNATMTEVRKEIGSVNNRIDDWLNRRHRSDGG